jgi:hypothetical protein
VALTAAGLAAATASPTRRRGHKSRHKLAADELERQERNRELIQSAPVSVEVDTAGPPLARAHLDGTTARARRGLARADPHY